MYEPTRAELPSGPLRTEKIGALMVAKAKAQGAFEEVRKASQGQDGNRRFMYAELGEIRRAAQAALSANGLAWESFFATEELEDGRICVYVWTELHHGESEQYQRTPLASFVVGPDAMKQIGGATTYLRRYQVQALLGIAAEEDNAEEGDDRAPAPRAAAAPRAAPEKTLEPGQDPPAMSAPAGVDGHAARARTAIADKDWRTAIAEINRLPVGALRRTLQNEYQAARYVPVTDTSKETTA